MFLKSVIPLLFLLRIVPKPPDAVLYDKIREVYGPTGIRTLNSRLNKSRKFLKTELDIVFLRHCKVYEVTPKFLRFKLYRRSLTSGAFYKKWQAKLLDRELQSKQQALKCLERACRLHEQASNETFSWLHGVQVGRFISGKLKLLRLQTERIHKKKLRNLGIYNSLTPVNPDKTVLNFSSTRISPRLRTLLAFGLDFALPTL